MQVSLSASGYTIRSQMAIEVEMKDPRVESVPEGVRMAFEYSGSEFFVRECYPVYYGQIQELLFSRGMKYISVTGTPGIGKSVFYLYVFNRVRTDYPDKTIVTASFSKTSKLKECVVFYPDGKAEPCFSRPGGYFIPTEYEVPKAIHLYDGPPDVEPPDSQMVAFTSPNEVWLDSIHKAKNHRELYMPCWTFWELFTANDLLELGIMMEVVLQRFGQFGGVARYCLSTDSDFLNKGLDKLEEGIGKIHSFEDVQACLNHRKDLREVVHRLFHYKPRKSEETGYFHYGDLIFCSKWISMQIEERIRHVEKPNRAGLMRMLDGVAKGGTMYGWLFECLAHETFQSGGNFTLVSLTDGEKQMLSLNPTVGRYDKFTSIMPLEKVFQDVYMIPSASNFESLYSFYYSGLDNKVYAFQITVSAVHDVNAYGLMKLVELSGLADKILAGEIQLVLVFVIPKGLGVKFNEQKIIFDDIPKIEDLAEYHVIQVRGIGENRFKRLRKEASITTAKDLFDAVKVNAPGISSVQKFATEFVEKVERRSSWNFLGSIPQFSIELSLESEYSR
jgi:hypothetical protein